MGTVVFESLQGWWPELILSLGALLTIVLGVSTKRSQLTLAVAWGSVLASLIALWYVPVSASANLFFGLIVCDPFSLTFRWLALASVGIVLLLVMASQEVPSSTIGECLGLLLLIGVGLMLMAEANHLLMVYLAMELVSLSAYVLVGFLHDARSAEASLKYLLVGALSSGIMLFGMSLLFGLTGELGFPGILRATSGIGASPSRALVVAVTLILAGLAFKISMVPFHMWTPDAYEGAPVAVTALLSVGPKAAGLALFLRFLDTVQVVWPTLGPLVLGLTVLTMTFGNLVALVQTNVKRLFAYSTIAQVGYLLIGVAVHSRRGVEALMLYLVAYLFMNLGVFACIQAVVNDAGNESLDAFRGLARRAPGLALVCTVFLVSLAGIPPLLGFFGKFLLFGSALDAHQWWLAIAAIVNSAVALYYYVNLVRLMYFVEPVRAEPLRVAHALHVALGICAIVTVVVGLFPGTLLGMVAATTRNASL